MPLPNGMAPRGNVFMAAISSASVTTAATDIFGLFTAPTSAANGSQVEIHEIRLGAYSTAAVSGAHVVGVQLFRGSTVSSTLGSITPAFRYGYATPTPPVSGSSVTSPSSVLVSTASATLLYCGAWNIGQEWVYVPWPEDRPIINMNQRFHVRVTAPAVALVVAGTLTFSEWGKPPQS